MKQALAVIPFLKGIKLFHSSSCRNPFDEWQNKRKIETTHSFRFTVFCRTEIVAQRYHTYLLLLCIYWKKSVLWQYQLQPPICSMAVSLFNGSTWNYVKDASSTVKWGYQDNFKSFHFSFYEKILSVKKRKSTKTNQQKQKQANKKQQRQRFFACAKSSKRVVGVWCSCTLKTFS